MKSFLAFIQNSVKWCRQGEGCSLWSLFGVSWENMNTVEVGTCRTCTHAVCSRLPTKRCEPGRNVLRRELTGLVTIVAACFEIVKSPPCYWTTGTLWDFELLKVLFYPFCSVFSPVFSVSAEELLVFVNFLEVLFLSLRSLKAVFWDVKPPRSVNQSVNQYIIFFCIPSYISWVHFLFKKKICVCDRFSIQS